MTPWDVYDDDEHCESLQVECGLWWMEYVCVTLAGIPSEKHA